MGGIGKKNWKKKWDRLEKKQSRSAAVRKGEIHIIEGAEEKRSSGKNSGRGGAAFSRVVAHGYCFDISYYIFLTGKRFE